MARIEIRMPEPYAGNPFPDKVACIMALPMVQAANEMAVGNGNDFVDELVCLDIGAVHGRTYKVVDVLREFSQHPEISCLFGIGNVDPAFGINPIPGRYLLGITQ